MFCNSDTRVTADLFRRLPSLGLIVTNNADVDHIDLPECHRSGIGGGCPKTKGAIEYRGSDSRPPPKSGEVRVRIICSSLCYNDVTYWKMKDPPAYFPRILGHESFGGKVTHHLVSKYFIKVPIIDMRMRPDPPTGCLGHSTMAKKFMNLAMVLAIQTIYMSSSQSPETQPP